MVFKLVITASAVVFAVVRFWVTTAEAVALDAALFVWMVHVPTCAVHTRLAHAAAAVAARPAMVAPVVPVKLSQPTTAGAETEVTWLVLSMVRAVMVPRLDA